MHAEAAVNISSYHFGHIEVAGQAFTSDVIITPEDVHGSWWRREGHSLHVADLDAVVAAHPDVLVIGTGYYGRMVVPGETQAYLEDLGIEVHTARTSAAVREFNELQKRAARIVAALHLTC